MHNKYSRQHKRPGLGAKELNKKTSKYRAEQPVTASVLPRSKLAINPIKDQWNYAERQLDYHPELLYNKAQKLHGPGVIHCALMNLVRATGVMLRLNTGAGGGGPGTMRRYTTKKVLRPIDKVETIKLLSDARRLFEQKRLDPKETSALLRCCRQLMGKWCHLSDGTIEIHWRYLHEIRKAVKRCHALDATQTKCESE